MTEWEVIKEKQSLLGQVAVYKRAAWETSLHQLTRLTESVAWTYFVDDRLILLYLELYYLETLQLKLHYLYSKFLTIYEKHD